jgi:hypothetical protein
MNNFGSIYQVYLRKNPNFSKQPSVTTLRRARLPKHCAVCTVHAFSVTRLQLSRISILKIC